MTEAILITYVHDRPGALARIANMFYRRGLNIRTLTVSGTHVPEISKMASTESSTLEKFVSRVFVPASRLFGLKLTGVPRVEMAGLGMSRVAW